MLKQIIIVIVLIMLINPVMGYSSNSETNLKIINSDENTFESIKRILSDAFSNTFVIEKIGWTSSKIRIADSFEFLTIDDEKVVDVINERYSFENGDNYKILTLISNVNNVEVKNKIFRLDIETGELIEIYETNTLKAGDKEVTLYWIIDRQNEKTGTYFIKQYYKHSYNSNFIELSSMKYVVKPIPPTMNLTLPEFVNVNEQLEFDLIIDEGSEDVLSYTISYGDGKGSFNNNLLNSNKIIHLNQYYEDVGTFNTNVNIIDNEKFEYFLTQKVIVVENIEKVDEQSSKNYLETLIEWLKTIM